MSRAPRRARSVHPPPVGYFYREILEIVRRKRALHLLVETDMRIADIAAGLGYEEHANFTRAFGRWMQCSPSKFRQLKTSGRASPGLAAPDDAHGMPSPGARL
ncbi:helix-turn-helix domain-containing protein [Xanthobacter autotrophicus]|uniref:Helix-turn-helix domain-containing protein n=1 Tax=Xanthobacter autotrophicus TaxID=280 RepID=A0A6C1KGG5_XANAU|nr:helix-turn-helix domain-containing protein [Xanthobacter autotrophicus]